MKLLISILLLGLSLFSFAQSAEVREHVKQSQNEIKVTQILKATQSWDGSPLPPYPSKNPEITIQSYEIASGVKLPMHKHPVINAGVILEGQLTVIAKDGKQLILNAGDSIVELVDQWHYGVNQGPTPVKLIVFYAGEVGVPLVIREKD